MWPHYAARALRGACDHIDTAGTAEQALALLAERDYSWLRTTKRAAPRNSMLRRI